MSLQTNIDNLATRIATEFKTLRNSLTGNNTGDLSALNTSAKGNLIIAINEVLAEALNKGNGDLVSTNNLSDLTDIAGARLNLDVYSTTETLNQITNAIADIVDSSPATLDTLNELAQALGDDPNFATTINTALGNRVRADVNNQNLTDTEKQNARTNIGAVSTADIGNTNTNFVTAFEDALI